MEATLHPAQARRVHDRSELLSLLGGFEADAKGLAGVEAAWLETLADDYLFGVAVADAEAKNAWSGFYRRVSGARRPRH
jgi:hypothetical protein